MLIPPRSCVLAAFACLFTRPLCAQATDPAANRISGDNALNQTDEVIVRGRRLSDFRFEVEAARVRVYDLFNELNSDDAFDVHCRVETSTGTRMRQHVCRAQFKDDIANAVAKAWVQGLEDRCLSLGGSSTLGGMSQECIFSDAANQAKSMAQAEQAMEGLMQKRFEQEMAKTVAANPELQQAMLDYEAVERAYNEARSAPRARGCDRPEPPARCLR
jgi:hypothetical protein